MSGFYLDRYKSQEVIQDFLVDRLIKILSAEKTDLVRSFSGEGRKYLFAWSLVTRETI